MSGPTLLWFNKNLLYYVWRKVLNQTNYRKIVWNNSEFIAFIFKFRQRTIEGLVFAISLDIPKSWLSLVANKPTSLGCLSLKTKQKSLHHGVSSLITKFAPFQGPSLKTFFQAFTQCRAGQFVMHSMWSSLMWKWETIEERNNRATCDFIMLLIVVINVF